MGGVCLRLYLLVSSYTNQVHEFSIGLYDTNWLHAKRKGKNPTQKYFELPTHFHTDNICGCLIAFTQVAKNMQEFEAANMKVKAFDLIFGNLMRSMMYNEISDQVLTFNLIFGNLTHSLMDFEISDWYHIFNLINANWQMGMTEEMMNDTLDDLLTESGDEEEQDAIVNQVVYN